MKCIIIIFAGSLVIFMLSLTAFGGMTSVYPPQNAVNIDKACNIQITFGSAYPQNNLKSDAIIIRGSRTAKYVFSCSFINGGRTINIDPSPDFKAGEVITVSLTNRFLDENGSPLIDGYQWQFIITSDYALCEFQQNTVDIKKQTASIVCGDLIKDNEGLEIAVVSPDDRTISLLKSTGGHFEKYSTIKFDRSPWKLVLGDFNNDGSMDIAVDYESYAMVSIFLNDGNGNFPTTSKDVNARDRDLSISCSLAPGDFDGDGDLDLAVMPSDYWSCDLIILGNDNNNNGIMTRVFSIDLPYDLSSTNCPGNVPCPGHWPAINTGDWNNDGKLDLLAVKVNFPYGVQNPCNQDGDYGSLCILKNDGTAQFSPLKTIDPYKDDVDHSDGITNDIFENPGSISVGDFDNDGKLDCAVGNDHGGGRHPGSVAIVKNDFTSSLYETPYTPCEQILADINGDGYQDIVARDCMLGYYTIITPQFYSQKITHDNVNVTGSAFTSGDLDNDGDLDLAISSDSSVLILYNNKCSDISFRNNSQGLETNLNYCGDLVIENNSTDLYSLQIEPDKNAHIVGISLPMGWTVSPIPTQNSPVPVVTLSMQSGDPLPSGQTTFNDFCIKINDGECVLKSKWFNSGHVPFCPDIICVSECKKEPEPPTTRHICKEPDYEHPIDWLLECFSYFKIEIPPKQLPWLPEPQPEPPVPPMHEISLHFTLEGTLLENIMFEFENLTKEMRENITIKGQGKWLNNNQLLINGGETTLSGFGSTLKDKPIIVTPIFKETDEQLGRHIKKILGDKKNMNEVLKSFRLLVKQMAGTQSYKEDEFVIDTR